MTVIKSKRTESGVEFINTARTIQMQTYLRTIKLPNRWIELGRTLENLAMNVLNEVTIANLIYLNDIDSCEERAKHFNNAQYSLSCLLAQIEFCREKGLLKQLTDKQWGYWLDPIRIEIDLLKKIKASDKSRIE